ncbi:MAG: FAD:protein FMN transferase [Clostridia bacterium]|nr:FAD:protein FMN transferase [Clostridia bacterium]
MKKVILSLLTLIFVALSLTGCVKSAENYVFGTYYSIEVEGKNAWKQVNAIEETLKEIESKVSTNVVESDVNKINNAKSNEPIQVSEITASLFRLSKDLYTATQGAFNPAIFPLIELWGFAPSNYIGVASNIPSQEEIDSLLPLCNFDLFTLTDNQITKARDGAKLDFGAIAKGYGADRGYEIVKNSKKAVIDVGRTLKVKGEISLMVADPRNSNFVATATLCNQSVATSGDYERYYFVEDKRYHHIIGKDGYPSGTSESSPIISATIIGESATICDALSTATLVLGYEQSKSIIENFGYSALLITETGYYLIGENVFDVIDQTRTKLN